MVAIESFPPVFFKECCQPGSWHPRVCSLEGKLNNHIKINKTLETKILISLKNIANKLPDYTVMNLKS